MPLDPAQRHQIEQDAITAAWEAKRLAACDDATSLLREIADLETDGDGDVIHGADEHGSNDLMSRVKSFLAGRPRSAPIERWLLPRPCSAKITPRSSWLRCLLCLSIAISYALRAESVALET